MRHEQHFPRKTAWAIASHGCQKAASSGAAWSLSSSDLGLRGVSQFSGLPLPHIVVIVNEFSTAAIKGPLFYLYYILLNDSLSTLGHQKGFSLSLLPPPVFSLVLLVRQKGEKNVSPVASLPHSLSKDSPAQRARSPGCCLLLGAYSL